MTREGHGFWKEVRDDERAKEKLQSIAKLEDAIEKSCGAEDKTFFICFSFLTSTLFC